MSTEYEEGELFGAAESRRMMADPDYDDEGAMLTIKWGEVRIVRPVAAKTEGRSVEHETAASVHRVLDELLEISLLGVGFDPSHLAKARQVADRIADRVLDRLKADQPPAPTPERPDDEALDRATVDPSFRDQVDADRRGGPDITGSVATLIRQAGPGGKSFLDLLAGFNHDEADDTGAAVRYLVRIGHVREGMGGVLVTTALGKKGTREEGDIGYGFCGDVPDHPGECALGPAMGAAACGRRL